MLTLGVLGIQDPWIWMAYVLCLLATALCVVYGLISRFRGADEAPAPQDAAWAVQEKKIEEEL